MVSRRENKKMIKEINKIDYPCAGRHNNIEASVVYDSNAKWYYILVAPQVLENKGSFTMVSTVPTECNRYLLREVNRRTKKRDAEANKNFLEMVSTLVSITTKKFNLTVL